MALTQTDELTDDVFPFDRASAAPGQLRKIFRSGSYRGTTAAMADGYTPVSYTHLTLPTILRV